MKYKQNEGEEAGDVVYLLLPFYGLGHVSNT